MGNRTCIIGKYNFEIRHHFEANVDGEGTKNWNFTDDRKCKEENTKVKNSKEK